MIDVESLINGLPDPEAARRFLSSLDEQSGPASIKLRKNDGLLSDVTTLASYSPLLATTLLQNPEYLWWLNRKRRAPAVRTKEELLEALGRFVLTNSDLDLHAQLARFRRRELLRIFLSDIRRLTTMAEITEDISNLADSILETALRRAEQDTQNRFGSPLVIDEKGRKTTAEFCIVSLGKLGSRELNYSSDIDLLFLYSADGETSGTGSRGTVTNREYFIKLSEAIVQVAGRQTGEGAAYRVDMRLRPHGRVGPLAISVDDAVRYYTGEARDWERQVLIRSRASAGSPDVFKGFFERVEESVFVSTSDSHPGEGGVGSASAVGLVLSEKDRSRFELPPQEENHSTTKASALLDTERSFVARALENVRRSKMLIDREQKTEGAFNVKLGRGGIREIEFIAQALQLAYGGRDRWLRASHTLISLSRLADRGLIGEAELTELFNAYEFLRHLEHVLQMENGLQTHTLPEDAPRRVLIARRMRFGDLQTFDAEIENHTGRVHAIFERVFESGDVLQPIPTASPAVREATSNDIDFIPAPILPADAGGPDLLDRSARAAMSSRDEFFIQLRGAIQKEKDFRHRLGAFRRRWSQSLERIMSSELDGELDIRQAKRSQTALAEASIDTALELTREELGRRYKTKIDRLPIAVIGLGKLGGGAIDYGSDLDLVLVYDQDHPTSITKVSDAEFYSLAAEIFVTTLSSMTRDGSIYRVDLRLRPYGKNGQSVISAAAFVEYMRDAAAIWEWLAYVKVRAVAGEMNLARKVETSVREIIHTRAATIHATELARETHRVRTRLEKEKAGVRRSKDIDIKYGSGGMLDVYFAMRYLQLRDNVPDRFDDRSTEFMLEELRRSGSLSGPDHEVMLSGYRFLASLDHNLRLTVGRTTSLPIANRKALEIISNRMSLTSAAELVELLTIHRLDVRSAFDNILSPAL